MKAFMRGDEETYVRQDRSKWKVVGSAYPGGKRARSIYMYVSMYVFKKRLFLLYYTTKLQ